MSEEATKVIISFGDWIIPNIKRLGKRIDLRLDSLENRIIDLEQRTNAMESLRLKQRVDNIEHLMQISQISDAEDIEVLSRRTECEDDQNVSRTIADLLVIRRTISACSRLPARTLAELRALCGDHDVRTSGIKSEIIDRLVEAGADPLENDLVKFAKAQLIQACEDRKIPKSGNKRDLARRLLNSVETPNNDQ